MLQLNNIVKTYTTGDTAQNALNGVNLSFRENEFVSILGQSGSGKTTMLNIIGGLDRYTSGDLIINGVSTKEYKDADWDYYRNNSIGFVFQSYNLIPHQTVLANVEMALTLAGVSPKERKQRAIAVLKKVGLGNHMSKKPNQMSGGQMQRVAIARALINNPDILLADEPTGALDSETSIQIMELLKEIAKDKLVIMVTHNPELAEKYSTRIVRLKDGNIIDDTNPYKEKEKPETQKSKKKISMSFFTALSLSFNNLRTKKGRTILTSFAGSIGIIGIALILALSTGMNAYIESVQKETMTAYPITISSETVDMSGIMGARKNAVASKRNDSSSDVPRNGIYVDYSDIKSSEQISSSIVKNNLTAFKKYLDDENSEIHKYLGENGIVYTYNVKFGVFSYNTNGEFINSDAEIDGKGSSGASGIFGKLNGGNTSPAATNFTEMMVGANGQTISQVVTDSYDVLYGSLPSAYNEVVLVTGSDNGIGAGTLYQLGLITKEQYDSAVKKIKNGENADEIAFSYEDILKHEFYLVAACDRYEKSANGTFSYIEENVLNEEKLLKNAIPLKITGIIKPKADASNANISSSVAYTSLLTDYLIEYTNESEIVKAQEATPDINVLTGIKFSSADNSEKVADAKSYLSSLSVSEKASFYKLMMYYSGSGSGSITDEASMAAALDMWLSGTPSEEILIKVYDEYIAGSTYDDNMSAFGKVSYDAPYSISIYTDTFEHKEAIANCIAQYNTTVEESEQITYTDYVALLTSSLTTIVDGISYVLIAFVSVSLIVSCIMIGIITHISVMERTKEIGILRALGASKRNISQVFNAETFIIGCLAGLLGIGVSYLAMLPINALIAKLSGISGLTAQLPFSSSLILILISIGITILGGLIPAKKAAKKDPVVALRTE